MKYYNKCRVCDSDDVITHGAVLSPFVCHMTFGMMPVQVSKLYNMENGTNYFPCLTIGCKKCEFIGCNILFDTDEMRALYKNYMLKEYNETRRIFEPEFTYPLYGRPNMNETQEWILSNLPFSPKTVLDFGAVVDTRTPFRDTAKVYLTDISTDIKITESVDLLTCLHVLEHVPDIRDTLHTIFSHDFKYAFFEVPYEVLRLHNSTLEEQVENKEFWHEHVNFFNMESFRFLLKDKILSSRQVNTNAIQVILHH
jgi:hypothetical protein